MTTETLQSLVLKQHKHILELKERLKTLEDQNDDVAIIGVGLRLPGDIETPEAFWQALITGQDLTGPLPDDRWSPDFISSNREAPGTFYWQRGAFLNCLKGFDPQYFGISRREALTMDPQQRLLLMVATEALERAGVALERKKGAKIGVFTGIMRSEYGQRLSQLQGTESIDFYQGTGSGHGFTAGRLSYTLGFTGPSLTIDTACSSSLVALHLACESLKRGECKAALVAASNVILDPELNIALCQAGALSPSGHCSSFDEAADGYTRGEGALAIVLMPLREAHAQGHPILGLVKSSNVNHGGPGSGLTIPNGEAQAELLADSLKRSGLSQDAISYIEAHGTGTALGDPIEIRALASVYGSASRNKPLYIGSVKSQLGHLEAAAGLASLVKCLLMMQHRVIPPQYGLRRLTTKVDWKAYPFRFAEDAQPWSADDRPRTVGISAFGIAGTNAHIVVSEGPQPIAQDAASIATILPISAKTEEGLFELREAYAQLAEAGRLDAAVLVTAMRGRAHHKHRLCVVADELSELKDQFRERGVTGPVPYAGHLRMTVAWPRASRMAYYAKLWNRHPGFKQDLLRLLSDDKADQNIEKELLACAQSGEELQTSGLALACLLAEAYLWQDLGFRLEPMDRHELTRCVMTALRDRGQEKRLLDAMKQLIPSPERNPTQHDDRASVEICSLGGSAEAATYSWILGIIARHYEAGAFINWDAFSAPHVPRSADNPTSPFQLEDFWVDGLVQRRRPQSQAMAAPVSPLAAGSQAAASRSQASPEFIGFLREVLSAETVDTSLSFIELGGDSFTAMLLVQKLSQIGFDLSMEELLSKEPIGSILDKERTNAHI
jgi:acyl transferase domain-containing protein